MIDIIPTNWDDFEKWTIGITTILRKNSKSSKDTENRVPITSISATGYGDKRLDLIDHGLSEFTKDTLCTFE